MRALVATVPDPFHPATRNLCEVRRRRHIRALAPRTDRPFVAILNGKPVLRASWRRRLQDGDTLAFVVLPRGGGGGSNPVQLILMIAVSIFAPGIGTALAGTLGITSEIGIALVKAAVGLIGSALVNAIIPPPKPPTPQQAHALAAPSPTYSLGAQGNIARLEEAIPVQYGRMLAFPDFAAQPYVEYYGNEQYLYQLLSLGLGEYAIESIRIEDTPIESFAEVSYEIIGPGDSLTLFPANVSTSVEVSGQELEGLRPSGTYTQSGTTITVTLTAHGFAPGKYVYLDFTSGTAVDGAFPVVSAPTANTFTVTAATSATTSGNVQVSQYLGGFIANASGTEANALGFDFVLPRGLYHANAETGDLEVDSLTVSFEARTVDEFGDPVGAWAVLNTVTYTANTTTPQRYSERVGVAAGRYEVRCRRTDVKQTDSLYGNDLLWAGLRAYLPETRDFGYVTLLALRMRASNNLSAQASRKINVISTRKLPIWNGSSWSAATATRSIAWAIADAAKDTTYGAGLPDARLDLAGLLELDAIWAARGDEFNGRFENALTFWEAVTRIAGVGRARPYLQGGVLRLFRDQAATLPVALFSMRNIQRGSFGIDYLLPTEETADAAEVTYFDRDYWSFRRVSAALPDSTAVKPAKLDLFGCTSRDQAYREGLYYAASNRYRRCLARFATEMEGFIPSLGDLIAVQHDMPAWGQHAEAVDWDAGTLTLTLSEELTWTSVAEHYVGLRAPDGSLDGPYAVVPGALQNLVELAEAPDVTPYTGSEAERTHVVFGPGETWRALMRVVSVKPRGLYSVEIEAVNEDPSVHTADQGVTAPPVNYSQLTTRYTAPRIANLIMRASTDDPNKALLTWAPAPGAESYQIEMAFGTDPYEATLKWTRVGETSAANFAVSAIYGVFTLIRVRGVGLVVGPWVTIKYGSDADYIWDLDSSTLMWSATDTDPMWTY